MNEIERALQEAGVEVYNTEGNEVQIAERVRLHLMDSGIRVSVDSDLCVRFTAHAQQSDAPNADAAMLLSVVRDSIGQGAADRGYIEASAVTMQIKDPVNESHVLDTWHEVTYEKRVQSPSDAVVEVRWALDVEKYVEVRAGST